MVSRQRDLGICGGPITSELILGYAILFLDGTLSLDTSVILPSVRNPKPRNSAVGLSEKLQKSDLKTFPFE